MSWTLVDDPAFSFVDCLDTEMPYRYISAVEPFEVDDITYYREIGSVYPRKMMELRSEDYDSGTGMRWTAGEEICDDCYLSWGAIRELQYCNGACARGK